MNYLCLTLVPMATKSSKQRGMRLQPVVPMNLRTSVPDVDSIRPKTKELLMYCCSCHGNLVTTAMRYMADAYSPKEPPCQLWAQYILRQRSYECITVVATAT